MCSTIGIYFTITNIKLGFSIFKAFIKFMIKLHLHFVLEWVNLICTCQPSNALQHYVMATNTFCLNFFTHRAGPHAQRPAVNYHSNHPTQHKISCIRTLFNRIDTHCNTEQSKQEEHNFFYSIHDIHISCFASLISFEIHCSYSL